MSRPRVSRFGLSLLLMWCVAAGPSAAAAPTTPVTRAVAPTIGADQEEGASQEILERGEEVYLEQCVSCHGDEGKGDGAAARFLESEPRDFSAGEWRYATDGTVEALATVVRDGIDDTAMTPFSDMLTEEEIVSVVTYVLEELAPEQEGGGPDSGQDRPRPE